MVYVAGCQDVTVADYQIIDDQNSRKRLQFLGVRQVAECARLVCRGHGP
jgi:hypothetical protein